MKIRVQREDGRWEEVWMEEGVWDVVEGRELFFTKEGYYDGWGLKR
jgi:hypothetical protein